jgi:hypothetical protein
MKHRLPILRNDIAGKKISYNPQKLQAKLATVKVLRGRWRKVGQAGRKKWLPCQGSIVEQSWIGRRNGHWQGGNGWRTPAPGASARWQRFSRGVQAECLERTGSECVVGMKRFRRLIMTGRSRRAAPAASAGRQGFGMTSASNRILP